MSDLKVTASDALEFEAIQSERPKSRRGLKFAAWGVGVAVLLGVGWYALGGMMLRMVGSGDDDIPHIHASVGPVKVRPENPGGLQVPNRDKLVYERIQPGAATGGAALVERLLPQPEKPLPKPLSGGLAPATPPSGAAGAVGAVATVLAPGPETPSVLPTARVPAVKDVTSVIPPPPPPPVSASLASSRLRTPTETTSPGAGAPLSLKRRPRQAPQPAVAPQPKPKVQAAVPSPPVPVPAAPAPAVRAPARATPAPAPPKPKAGAVTQGRFRVQLAAARTPDQVQSEWSRMRRRHLDLLGDLGLTVTKADLGPQKGVFYRLRVGPLTTEASARALCRALSARKMGCLVVKPGR